MTSTQLKKIIKQIASSHDLIKSFGIAEKNHITTTCYEDYPRLELNEIQMSATPIPNSLVVRNEQFSITFAILQAVDSNDDEELDTQSELCELIGKDIIEILLKENYKVQNYSGSIIYDLSEESSVGYLIDMQIDFPKTNHRLIHPTS